MMENLKNNRDAKKTNPQDGSALVIALLVLVLLMGFTALAISRTSTEILMTGNDIAESKSYAASEASLENMTRDFVDIFERKLVPSTADIDTIKNKTVPGFDNYSFATNIVKTSESTPTTLTGGSYSGLYAMRDAWEVDSYATDKVTDVKVQLKRRFYSDRIPIFQFGIFYEDDLEVNRPPFFTFGGRVHTNGNLFVTAQPPSWGQGIYFNSRVTAVGEVVNDIWKPGTGTNFTDGVDNQSNVFINDASGNPQELITGEGSVNCVSPSGTNVFASNPNLPNCSANPNWDDQKVKFQGNLDNKVSKLNMPLTKLNIDMAEIVKRGKNVGDLHNSGGTVTAVTSSTKDNSAVSKERFTNKPGLRISLADSQDRLPGCAGLSAGTICGVRLDGALGTSSIGYTPLAMTDGYQATALNATRMAMTGREIWIKVEMVSYDFNTDLPIAIDVTQDILSLGVTEPAPIGTDLQIDGYTTLTDTRSIIKLQRFSIPGPAIPNLSSTTFTTNYTLNGTSQNLVVRYNNVTGSPATGCATCTAQNIFSPPVPEPSAASSMTQEDAAHLKWATISGSQTFAIVPFPIQMFDTREGMPNDDATAANTNFGTQYVPSAGVMSLVDIDVANLRRFFNGDFNNLFPTATPFAVAQTRGLLNTDVPNAQGWVVYVSDRRGDYDFDGEYDMEDIFPDSTLQFNEDINFNGTLNTDYGREAASYTTSVASGQAATADHLYYRRGVRLINGSVLPGVYDSTTPTNTKGFTFASENGVYVKGNYNATGVSVSGSSAVTPPENYSPQNTANHIPAAIAADAVVILSNNWNDANSFANPFNRSSRVASDTVVRFAMLSGDPITGLSTFYQPSYFGQLNGGVINFKRFLEDWYGRRLNYTGSLINLFNSRNNNSFIKCCNTVYRPPIRDWAFDTSFLNVNRLPPGTPYIYSITFTGFQRVNE
jgi:Tfp pilus assembly protein PilX